MSTVKVIKLIRTDLLRRGEGKDSTGPVRIIIQYWDFEGNLILEYDTFLREPTFINTQLI
jgi:hypothetical protein